MGVPLVGKRHHRKANTSQGAVGMFGTISKRISGMCGSRRSSVNDQQSIQAEQPAENNREYSLGALLSRGVASERDIHARCISGVCQKLDSATMGKAPFGGNQDYRGRALATSSTNYRRDQSQDKVRYVGGVLARCSLGILWPQSNFVGNTSWNRRKERAKHWRARQCETSEVSLSAVTRRSQTRSDAAGISRPASRVFGGRLGNPSRGTWGTAWLDCEFENMNFSVQHSYYWRRGGHLKSTKTEASAKLLPMHPSLKQALLEWRSQSLYNQPGDFVFPSERLKGSKPLDLASVLKKKIQPAFRRIGITGVGWHTFRHTVGTMLAEMGEHQLMIRDYLRHANLHVTNKYLQATTTSKRLAQGKLVDAILPGGVLSASKSTLVH